ncbi:LOW QUALITY PROTEIN: hypothetical protein Cgig2_020149 [Carnegiea gigantea]|uniref:Uncharacterized protein n=1 Tax=Carnegiea gigantea TaxID=171969 RepID=A0A9Q1QHI3_9CARY|nr:LOW QUALITY PROTEIN: hypothetical protein Cgig2_020149 [Carnegiea gigantea]
MMILPSPSHQNPSPNIGFLIFANFRRPARGARELPSLSFFSESSGFWIQCTLYTASIPLSHPLPLYYPKIRGFIVPSCCGLDGFHNHSMCPLMKDSMIKVFRLLNCSAPTVIQLQPANCRGNYGCECPLCWLVLGFERRLHLVETYRVIWVYVCRVQISSLAAALSLSHSSLQHLGTVNCIFTPNGMLIIIKIMNTLLCSTQYSSSNRLPSIRHSLGLKIVWNVLGAKRAQVVEEVKILKCTAQLDILFLIETMTNEKNSRNIIKKNRKQLNGSWMFEKLDRGIAREDFANLYPSLCATHGAFTFSNHCPIIISIVVENRQQQPCPFRFQPFWTKYHVVDQIIYKNWQTTVNGAKMFRLMHKLKAIKNSIKPWAKSIFGISKKKSSAIWIKLIMWKKIGGKPNHSLAKQLASSTD